MTIKRRGVEARIVINGVSQRNPDPTLVDLIARAHLYLIPTVIDQNPCVHCRRPIDMIFHGRACSVRQA
jgi:hypothetical protein